MDHPEHKFVGEIGILTRKHIDVDGAIYLGKEANGIDEQELDVRKPQVFLNKQDIMNKIMQLNPEAGRKVGISYRGTLKRIQDKIKCNGDINLNAKFMRKLADQLM